MAEASGLTEVDFEIALTALVASAVATFPTETVTEYSVVKVLAVGLLALTLIRRLAVINNLRKGSPILGFTTHLLNLFTYISVLYLFYNLSIRISGSHLVSLSPQALFIVITPTSCFILLLFQEIELNDALRGSEKLFTTKSDEHRGSVFGGVLTTIAIFVGNRRQLVHDETRQSNLGEFYEHDVEDMSPEEMFQWTKSTFSFLLGVVFIPFGSFTVLFGVGSRIFGISWFYALALLISVLLVVGLVDIWYSLYGVIGAGERNGYFHFLIIIFTYIFVGKMLFGF